MVVHLCMYCVCLWLLDCVYCVVVAVRYLCVVLRCGVRCGLCFLFDYNACCVLRCVALLSMCFMWFGCVCVVVCCFCFVPSYY